ncbi:hypothetical protein H2200_009474 [Cladophialophora chaetospira]|uniref:Uncharacterized protein n=1 Tax=Cladophialophora chaetospira TaxID=386627 RepID=A0AA38X2L1_9EURO|nr:hypothetical protein H2200_009474 [Cladophialophora chaetospira]
MPPKLYIQVPPVPHAPPLATRLSEDSRKAAKTAVTDLPTILDEIGSQELRGGATIEPLDDPRVNVLSQARNLATMASAHQEAVDDVSDKLDLTTKDLERLEISHGIQAHTNLTSQQIKVTDMIHNILLDNDPIVPTLQQRGHDFGAVSTEMLTRSGDAVQEAQDEISRLREALAKSEQRNQNYANTMRNYDPDVQSVNSNMGKTISFVQSLILLPGDFDSDVNWEQFQTKANTCLELSRQWTHDHIQPSAEQWLSRLRRHSRPTKTSFSAQQMANRLLAQSFMETPNVSLADIHALAHKTLGLEPHELRHPLALLHGFLYQMRTRSLIEDRQFTDSRALILLRGIELFCDHLSSILDLQEVAAVFEEIRPFLQEACRRSPIIQGLTTYIDAIFNKRHSQVQSLATTIHSSAAYTIDFDEKSWFRDGDNLVAFSDDSITLFRPSEVRVECDESLEGWSVVIHAQDHQHTSEYITFDRTLPMQKVMSHLLDRLNEGNSTITPDDASWTYPDA